MKITRIQDWNQKENPHLQCTKKSKHTSSILSINILRMHDESLGHILNIFNNIVELQIHHRELSQNILPTQEKTLKWSTVKTKMLNCYGNELSWIGMLVPFGGGISARYSVQFFEDARDGFEEADGASLYRVEVELLLNRRVQPLHNLRRRRLLLVLACRHRRCFNSCH